MSLLESQLAWINKDLADAAATRREDALESLEGEVTHEVMTEAKAVRKLIYDADLQGEELMAHVIQHALALKAGEQGLADAAMVWIKHEIECLVTAAEAAIKSNAKRRQENGL